MENLQKTITWCLPFLKFQPLTIGSNEPALTIANMVLQQIFGPPFCWRFNRAETTFNCIAAPVTQDYAVALPDFAFIEKAWLVDGVTEAKEITVKAPLAKTLDTGRPAFVGAQFEDTIGNITFRLLNAPDKAYVCNVQYQKKAALLTSLASLWPMPAEMSYIYNQGFLALASIMCDDHRASYFVQRFTAALLGAQDGLDELQKMLWLGNWLEVTKAVERAQMKTQQAVGGRQYS
jgi:hypothetical protein